MMFSRSSSAGGLVSGPLEERSRHYTPSRKSGLVIITRHRQYGMLGSPSSGTVSPFAIAASRSFSASCCILTNACNSSQEHDDHFCYGMHVSEQDAAAAIDSTHFVHNIVVEVWDKTNLTLQPGHLMPHDNLRTFFHIWSSGYPREKGEPTARHPYDVMQLLVRFLEVVSDSLSHAP